MLLIDTTVVAYSEHCQSSPTCLGPGDSGAGLQPRPQRRAPAAAGGGRGHLGHGGLGAGRDGAHQVFSAGRFKYGVYFLLQALSNLLQFVTLGRR